MSANETKEKILDVALALFSQKGFSAVSIRDICKEVSIKESSVYYHFKNKQAILSELQARFEQTSLTLTKQLESAFSDPKSITGFNGDNVSKVFFEDYLMNDFCNKFIRLLYIEKSYSEEMQKVYDKWIFAKPLEIQRRTFDFLTAAGAVKDTDSEYLALKYYSPILLLFQRYLLSGELTKAKKDLFTEKANYHILCFFKEIGVM